MLYITDVIHGKLKKSECPNLYSDKDFEHEIGRVINNAKDWDGQRTMRKKSSEENTEETI